MKKYFLIIFLILYSSSGIGQTVQKIFLHSNWKFRQVGKERWYPAEVLGTVHTDLLKNNLIPDPYFRDNEKKLQWIENEDWEYKMIFNLDDDTYSQNIINLVFEGLDTYAKVYLNDVLIISADNMFRKWEFECKELLNKKGNELKIIFASPVRIGDSIANAYYKENDIKGLPGGNRVFTRKAAYHYGWDFAPRFVTSGIWRQVYLEAWSMRSIGNLSVDITELSASKADIILRAEISEDFLRKYTEQDELNPEDIYYSITDEKGRQIQFEKINRGYIIYKKSFPGYKIEDVLFKFDISNPKLWWCNGLGEPYLYTYKLKILIDDEVLDEKSFRFGIRKVELVQEKDSGGESFYFKLNDVPVFMKGANFIPMDCFLPNVSKEKYQKIIKDVKESNMNMLRVWGGGVYENDEFYNQCDENGILVWQDFMFACAMNPGDSIFLSNVKQEATDNIKRLQNHPSIALWCGNNEVDEGWQNWGWQKEFNYTGKDSAFIREDYLKLFNDIIPECLNLKGRENKIVTDIPGEDYPYNFFRDNKYFCRNYIPSSPKIGWGHPEAMKEGDSHYWGVWWGMEPFEVLEKKAPRFMSEYGFQAFPDFSTIEKFTFPEDRFLYSDALKSHQKHPIGFETIQKYMERDFVITNDFNEYIKTSQTLQAYGIKKAIEAQRRVKPYCMGTLFWQLNDCWPGVTWSAIDYYGKKKLLQSVVSKCYDKILISPTIEDSLLKVFIISDKLTKTDGALYLNLKNAITGETVYYKEIRNEIPENSSKIYFQTDLNSLFRSMNKDEFILECKFISSDNSEEYDNNFIFVKPKEYKGVLK